MEAALPRNRVYSDPEYPFQSHNRIRAAFYRRPRPDEKG